MDKYAVYPNLYELITQIDNNTVRQNLQKLISIILQNATDLSLTSGQIKLAFCFISKVKHVLYDTKQCLKIIHSELLTDYLPIQLTKINTLLSHGNEQIAINNPHPFPDVLKPLETINTITTQEQYNNILLTSCNYVESSPPISNNPVIHLLVNRWFYLDEMYL
jgi:hypothetical protein